MKALLAFLVVVTVGSVVMLGVLARRATKATQVIRDASDLHARLDAYARKETP